MTASPADLPRVATPVLTLGTVTLSVADLDRSLEYYRQSIGLTLLSREPGKAMLGAGQAALLELHEQPGAAPSRPNHTGLYHMAILLPDRADLGRFVRHLIDQQVPVQGASDHLVSEAIYLQDPDGHGLEVYADRERSGWAWQDGQVRMDTVAADIAGIVGAAGADPEWRGLPAGTVIGHVHLKVADLESTRAFYQGLLGMDVVADLSRQGALFVSQGGYHHHFGLNIWGSRNGLTAPDSEARLRLVRVGLPAADLEELRSRLQAAELTLTPEDGGFEVSDPSGNRLRFEPRPA